MPRAGDLESLVRFLLGLLDLWNQNVPDIMPIWDKRQR